MSIILYIEKTSISCLQQATRVTLRAPTKLVGLSPDKISNLLNQKGRLYSTLKVTVTTFLAGENLA